MFLTETEHPEFEMCECELDWRCPMHAGQPTPIELMNHYDAQEQADIDRQNGQF